MDCGERDVDSGRSRKGVIHMLTSKDHPVLGIAPEAVRARRPTAVSQILRAISEDIDRNCGEWVLPAEEDGQPGYRILVASDRSTRQSAYTLAHRLYRNCGYVSGETGM